MRKIHLNTRKSTIHVSHHSNKYLPPRFSIYVTKIFSSFQVTHISSASRSLYHLPHFDRTDSKPPYKIRGSTAFSCCPDTRH